MNFDETNKQIDDCRRVLYVYSVSALIDVWIGQQWVIEKRNLIQTGK